MAFAEQYDVVIIGAGLAGLSLARQLLLNSEKKILLVEKRAEIPPSQQKVGEATVQVSGYYFSKVLDLEEHLLREHFMKYNLRFLLQDHRARKSLLRGLQPGLHPDVFKHPTATNSTAINSKASC